MSLGPPMGSGGSASAQSLLEFSADEQVVVTGGPDSIARFWRAPALPARDELQQEAERHVSWPSSGDAVAIATPDASVIVIGDRQGDVHIVSAAEGRDALRSEDQEVSFLGHSSAVRLLTASQDGTMVASAAEDNSIRIWDAATGIP